MSFVTPTHDQQIPAKFEDNSQIFSKHLEKHRKYSKKRKPTSVIQDYGTSSQIQSIYHTSQADSFLPNNKNTKPSGKHKKNKSLKGGGGGGRFGDHGRNSMESSGATS